MTTPVPHYEPEERERRIEAVVELLRERFSLGWSGLPRPDRDRHYRGTAEDVLDAADEAVRTQ